MRRTRPRCLACHEGFCVEGEDPGQFDDLFWQKKKLKELEMAAADMSRYTAKRQRCYPSRGKRKISKCKEKSRDKSSVAPKTPTRCLTSSLSGL